MNQFGRNRKGPSWRVICDKREVETLQYKLSLALSDDPSPFSIVISNNNKPCFPFAMIYCDIVNSMDETEIRKSAEFIRKRIDYPFAMFCLKVDENTGTWIPSFLHTPDGELYKENEAAFEVIPLYPSEETIDRMVLEYSKASLWPGRLPSEVTDQEYLYLPSTEEGKAKMTNDRGGKWMIFTPRSDMARHDDIFLAMVTLSQNGILVGLKAATAMPNKQETFQKRLGSERKCVMLFCYTADSENKEDVLRAAQAIQNVVQNKSIIYYKTNSASCEGSYVHEGKRHVTKYMYTAGGGFYERDDWKRFKLLVPPTN